MNTICNILGDIAVTLLSAAIIAILVFLFKNKLRQIFFSNDLLPASKVPNIAFSLGEGTDDDGLPLSFLTLQNNCDFGVSKIRVFCYQISPNEEEMEIKFFSKNIEYQQAYNGNGETAWAVLKDIQSFFCTSGWVPARGLFVEMLDENKTIFCKTLGIFSNERGELEIVDSCIKRLRKRLPKRHIKKRVVTLVKKYGVDASVG